MKWKDKLTKKELEHLKDNGILTLREFKIVAEKQKCDRSDMSGYEPCWDCRFIAKKLELRT